MKWLKLVFCATEKVSVPPLLGDPCATAEAGPSARPPIRAADAAPAAPTPACWRNLRRVSWCFDEPMALLLSFKRATRTLRPGDRSDRRAGAGKRSPARRSDSGG